MIIVYPVAAVITAWLIFVSIMRGWSPKRLAARGRLQLITSVVDVVVVLAVFRAVAGLPGPWAWLWLLPAVGVGVGVAGLIRRWPTLSWSEVPRQASRRRSRPTWRVTGAVVYVAAGVIVVGLLA